MGSSPLGEGMMSGHLAAPLPQKTPKPEEERRSASATTDFSASPPSPSRVARMKRTSPHGKYPAPTRRWTNLFSWPKGVPTTSWAALWAAMGMRTSTPPAAAVVVVAMAMTTAAVPIREAWAVRPGRESAAATMTSVFPAAAAEMTAAVSPTVEVAAATCVPE